MLRTALLALMACHPRGLVLDIDGTLSPIAATPEEARLYPGMAELLQRLRRHARLAVLTGRSVATAAALVGVEGITYIGNHGLEWSPGQPAEDAPTIPPGLERYREPARRLLEMAQQLALAGLRVEYKSIGGTIHYRLCPDPQAARERILALLAAPAREAGLLLSEGKMAVEVRVPGLNKGEALRLFVEHEQLCAAFFAGDDRTDLDAVEMLARLREQGLITLAVAVRHADTPELLLERADMVVEGVEGMYRLLSELAELAEAGEAGEDRAASRGEIPPPGWQEKRA
jgi:trehalose 6-phosphate phosphatase